MNELFIICCACSFAYWAYRQGKRAGSKAAYRVGLRHGRRRK